MVRIALTILAVALLVVPFAVYGDADPVALPLVLAERTPTVTPTPTIVHSAVEGTIYEDVNRNGLRDGDEWAIFNAYVELTDAFGQVLAFFWTWADGRYEFRYLAPDVYCLRVTCPWGWAVIGESTICMSLDDGQTHRRDFGVETAPTPTATWTRTVTPSQTPSRTQTWTPAPTSTTTRTPTPSVTRTPTSTPTITPTPKPVLVTGSCWRTDGYGDTRIHGEVRNNLGTAIQYVKVTARARDAWGALLWTDYTYADADVLASGVTSPFNVYAYDIPTAEWRSLDFVVDYSSATSTAARQLTVLNHRITTHPFYAEIVGEARNDTGQTVTYPEVLVVGYADGQVAGVGYEDAAPNTLSPGETCSFGVTIYSSCAPIQTCSIQVVDYYTPSD